MKFVARFLIVLFMTQIIAHGFPSLPRAKSQLPSALLEKMKRRRKRKILSAALERLGLSSDRPRLSRPPVRSGPPPSTGPLLDLDWQEEPWITRREASEIARSTRGTISRWVKRGLIRRAARAPGKVLFSRPALLAYMKHREAGVVAQLMVPKTTVDATITQVIG